MNLNGEFRFQFLFVVLMLDPIGSRIGDNFAEKIGEALKVNTTLTFIDLGGELQILFATRLV